MITHKYIGGTLYYRAETLWFNKHLGYGFIRCCCTGRVLFCHHSSIQKEPGTKASLSKKEVVFYLVERLFKHEPYKKSPWAYAQPAKIYKLKKKITNEAAS